MMKKILCVFQLFAAAILFSSCQDLTDNVADDTRPANTYRIVKRESKESLISTKVHSIMVYYEEGFVTVYQDDSYHGCHVYPIINLKDSSDIQATEYGNDYSFTFSFDAIIDEDEAGNQTLVHYEIVDVPGSTYLDWMAEQYNDPAKIPDMVVGESVMNIETYNADGTMSPFYSGNSDITAFIHREVRYVDK